MYSNQIQTLKAKIEFNEAKMEKLRLKNKKMINKIYKLQSYSYYGVGDDEDENIFRRPSSYGSKRYLLGMVGDHRNCDIITEGEYNIYVSHINSFEELDEKNFEIIHKELIKKVLDN